MYNQSEPRIDPPEDMDDYREAQSGILVANQKIRMLDEQDATLCNIRAMKTLFDAIDKAIYGKDGCADDTQG